MRSKFTSSLKVRHLKYYMQEVMKSLVRNKIMTLTSIATVSACIIIVIATYAVAVNVNHLLSYFENTVGITVFLENFLADDQVENMHGQIAAMPNVASVDFISSEQALEDFVGGFDEDMRELILELSPNLRRSFFINLYDIRFQQELITSIERMHGIGTINHAATLTDILINVNSFLGLFNLLVIVVLAILSVVIITNTIKLTVNNRRNEIIIMKYVGATDWFIKCPFMIEGIVIGVIGAILPLIAAWVAYDHVVAAMTGLPIVGYLPFRSAIEVFPLLVPIILVLGAAIGIFGSITSMRKYLSV